MGFSVTLLPMPPAVILRALNTGLLRFALRFSVAALVLIIVLFCGFRAYTVYLTHRAVLLLDEATRIQIGANEDFILPFVARYGAVKQAPTPPEPTDFATLNWPLSMVWFGPTLRRSPLSCFGVLHPETRTACP